MMIETRFEYEMTERLVRATEEIARCLARPKSRVGIIQDALEQVVGEYYGESGEDTCYDLQLLADRIDKRLTSESEG